MRSFTGGASRSEAASRSGGTRRSETVGRARAAGRPVVGAVAVIVATALWASPLVAQDPGAAEKGVAEKGSTGREHVVRKGDTLWDLAKFYLSNPFLWGLIHEANRDLVKNPHLIYPRDRLVIPDGSSLLAGGARGVAPLGFGLTGESSRPGLSRTLFYREPPVASAQAEGSAGLLEEAARREVLAVQPGEFRSAPWLAERSEVGEIGSITRIVGHGEDRDKITQSVHPFDRVYIRFSGRTAPEVGSELLLVREGRRVRGWGRVYAPGGVGVVEEVHKDVVLVQVREQFGPIGPGDLALPYVPFAGAPGVAEPVSDGVEAVLLGFEEEQPLYDHSDLGFVDLGSQKGVAIGDEFEVYNPERLSGGWGGARLPEEVVARLRVVRVEERTATVRLFGITQGSVRAGLPVRLVKKMP